MVNYLREVRLCVQAGLFLGVTCGWKLTFEQILNFTTITAHY